MWRWESALYDITPHSMIFPGNLTFSVVRTFALEFVQTRSFCLFGVWNNSKEDSSENKTLRQTSIDHIFLSIQNFSRAALCFSVNLGWICGFYGLTLRFFRKYVCTVTWEIENPLDFRFCEIFRVDFIFYRLSWQWPLSGPLWRTFSFHAPFCSGEIHQP